LLDIKLWHEHPARDSRAGRPCHFTQRTTLQKILLTISGPGTYDERGNSVSGFVPPMRQT